MTTRFPGDAALLEMVYAAIDDFNGTAKAPLVKAPETDLFGERGPLDSLSLVHLIIALEQQALDRTGLSLALADEKAFSPTRSPFRDVSSLVHHLRDRLAEAGK